MTEARLNELNALHDKIEQVKNDIRAIEGGPYGVTPSKFALHAVYTNDPNTDYILTISEDNYPELKDLILTFLNERLAKLEKEDLILTFLNERLAKLEKEFEEG